MTSIVPFLGNTVFEAEDIKLTSDAYNNAIEDVYGFGHPNKIVGKMIATRTAASATRNDCVKGLSLHVVLVWIALPKQKEKGSHGVKQSAATMTSASTIADQKSCKFNSRFASGRAE
jgi:hypothetical protein